MRDLVLRIGIIFFSLVGTHSAYSQSAGSEPLRTAGDHPVNVGNLRLELKVDLPGKMIDSRAQLSFSSLRNLDSLTLDAEAFEVRKVEFAVAKETTKPIKYSHDGEKLVVNFDRTLPTGTEGELIIDYRVRNPKKGLYFFAPSPEEPNVPLTVWSQGESTMNRCWIPCFDRPSIRQSTELIVTVAEGNEVLSNGKLVSKKSDPATKMVTFHWRQELPHPSYLITLVVGPFAVVEQTWRGKPVQYYVPPARKGDALRTFDRTPEMIELFSKKFGVDYAWDKYAQIVLEQFIEGGMENTSATSLIDCLLDSRAALDEDAEGLISHELGHQWWGDLLTCRDWAHIWLNEGFASYSECLWDEHANGPDAYSLNILGKAEGARSAVNRPVVDRRYPNPDAMFDARAYPKGAFILHMLRQQLGDEIFFAGLKEYLTVNRLKSVETVDFRRAMEKVSSLDLEKFFFDWTERPGHPKLDVSAAYETDPKRVRVIVKQTQSGEPFFFPLKVRLAGTKNQEPLIAMESITQKEQTFYIPCPTRPLGIEIDPYQAVLAEIKEDKSRDLWVWQIGSGTTAVSRVFAARHFAKSKLKQDREVLIQALPLEKTPGVAQAIMTAMAESGGEECKAALLEELKVKNPKLRRTAASSLARFGKDEKIADTMSAILNQGDESAAIEAEAISIYSNQKRPDAIKVLTPWLQKPSHREALRNAALKGLANTQDLAVLTTLIDWTKKDKPYDCRSTAVSALSRLVKTDKATEAEQNRAVEAIAALLTGEGIRLKSHAVRTLQGMGAQAKPALKQLEEIASKESDEGLVEAAKKAVTTIRDAKMPTDDLKKLQTEVEKLKKEAEELRNRLDKFEKKVSK
ncbi:hypothetical protein KIH39_06450 [Telmatocola sphagniphila]|uniref:Aminopeptidase N n=1 Tax=Telmatocola sphagniphila TaxID=1123043 RepID=A0A8E6EW88_9BACT|nr:M1 family aminopeptidase [Telmatocola sphagniphila]QVL33547.1 hypothetical protein KIH39_06450 [Telmatocola sphagniphila]